MKKYKIREGSIMDYVISALPFTFLLLMICVCSAITGTY